MGKLIVSIVAVVAVVYFGVRFMKGETPSEMVEGVKEDAKKVSQELSSKQEGGDAKNELPGYSVTQIAEHGTESSCWTIVRGKVYDVTPSIKTHPGGPDKILAMCGKDATEAFVGKHGGMPKQETGLLKLQIGVLEK